MAALSKDMHQLLKSLVHKLYQMMFAVKKAAMALNLEHYWELAQTELRTRQVSLMRHLLESILTFINVRQ